MYVPLPRRALVAALAAIAASLLVAPSALASYPGLDGALLVGGKEITADGGSLVAWASDPSVVGDASFSPDGRQIAYTDPHGQAQWIAAADGSGAHQLAALPFGKFGSGPTWSPDGSRIAYTDGTNLYIAPVDGSAPPQVLPAGNANDAMRRLEWSPDGSRIAALTSTGGLALMATDGTGYHVIRKGYIDGFDWSPDGSLLVTGSSGIIRTIRLDGTTFDTIATGRTPCWSPDGRSIAYADSRTGATEMVRADGSRRRSFSAYGVGPYCSWQPLGAAVSLATSGADAILMPVTVSGALAYASGADASGQTVTLTLTDPNGASTPLPDATTGAGGAFATGFTPSSTGTWRVTAQWPGDGTYPAQTRLLDVVVGLRDSGLSLHPANAAVTYGRATTLALRLPASHSNQTVTVTSRVAGAAATVVGQYTVSPGSTVTIAVSPSRNAVYEATWPGDDWYKPADVVARVDVRPALVTAMSRAYRTRHGYRLYHYSSRCSRLRRGCPGFAVGVSPNERDEPVTFTLERHTRHGWKKVASATFTLNRRSLAAVAFNYRARTVIGRRYRQRAAIKNLPNLAPANSAWSYFRVTS